MASSNSPVPAGYSWCVKEVTAPIDYVLDTGLHCTAILWTTTASRDLTVAVPETLASVTVYTHKYGTEYTKDDGPVRGNVTRARGTGPPPPPKMLVGIIQPERLHSPSPATGL